MTKKEARSILASLLACNTNQHIRAVIECPGLRENTQYVIKRNREIAEKMDMLSTYKIKMELHRI